MISSTREVVITGTGVVSPIGIGSAAVAESLAAGRSGVRRMSVFDSDDFPVRVGAEVVDFDPKQYVTPRKSLKVMSRSIQLAFAAAQMAISEAGVSTNQVSPERLGVVFGADMIQIEPEELIDAFRACIEGGRFEFDRWTAGASSGMFPLWMLKYLPNMPACHVAIALDARGPNNTIVLGEVSSLLAIAEGMRVIERGQADVMIVGGTGSRIHPMSWVFRDNVLHSRCHRQPEQVSRPFEAGRDGMVYGEGAAAFILESRASALARRAPILARVLGFGNAFETRTPGAAFEGRSIRAAIEQSLRAADMTARDIGHVNAHGLSTIYDDRAEALAIRDKLGDVPVTAFKSFFGNLGAGAGAVELVGSLLALQTGRVPATLNYEAADPSCPIHVVTGQPLETRHNTALLLNQTTMGQAVAMVLAGAS